MTIVVPVYNRSGLVVRCLDSIYAQTYRPLHVIVVDNGSTDDTVLNLNLWEASHIDSSFSMEILSEPQKGAAYARQTGLNTVTTEHVMFFDSDDVMRSYSVQIIMKSWKANPEMDILAWPLFIHHEKSAKLTHRIKGNLMERHLVHAIFCTLGYAVKTSFIKNAGGWDGKFSKWDDLEVGVRLMLNDPRVKSIDQPLADVYPQIASITGINFSSGHGEWEKTLNGIESAIRKKRPLDLFRLLNIVSYRRAILAANYAKEGRNDLAEPLYKQALHEVPTKKKPLIRFAYHWTRLGMRGAFLIIGKFL